jgi:hypothetical protein
MTSLREGGVGNLAQAAADDFCDGCRSQRPRHHHLRVRFAGQLFEDRLIGFRLRRTQTRHECDRKVLQTPRQIREKPQRGSVAPMKVVHQQ